MAVCQDIRTYVLTDHARWEMQRRNVTESEVARTLLAPEQRQEVRPGRCVYQSRFDLGEPPKAYLLRVFVDIDRSPPEVVTVYRTSKVHKYRR